ncbi:kelch repeat-containing protein [Archangium lansingense]|uniref:Fibrinogen-like YCDxxxxGGGW domain-containing protein n=1 Tax=Archangium lansingense TaxID=2995310 RepID=A0ABT3ZZW8_9BACT|nr:kelch repeat-containing protein [Archangium lansinium]MCY1074945.1 fibrinogen-like YCDxxxxGGGW domain-containing protein [Archangium lansinium]
MKMRTRSTDRGHKATRLVLRRSTALALAVLTACSGTQDEQQLEREQPAQALTHGAQAEAQPEQPAPMPTREAQEQPRTEPVLTDGSSAPTPASSAFTLDVVSQWEWKGSAVLPEHNQVMMTPVVVDVNRDGTPDIVFSSFSGAVWNAPPGANNRDGVLRAISGKDGHELWAVANPEYRVKPAASIAAGDIDGDRLVEICGIPETGRGIICFENDGTFKFRSAPDAYDYNEWGGPSLADLDGDGTVEILDGNRVYSHTGALKWVGSDGMGGALYTGPISFAADIDQDGLQEVINGRSVYRHDGSLKCTNTEIPHGFAAVGNFDEDPAGEIAVAGHGKVSLLDDNCQLLWTRTVHLTDPGVSFPVVPGHGGAPNLADFDGDGQLEIGLAGDWNYTVYATDGSVKWTRTVQDYSSGKSTSTTFDFEGDGQVEVIYADETHLRILDGATGALRWETRTSSGTTHDLPIVADVDADGSAEIIIAANNHAAPGFNGIRVFRDAQDAWVGTRGIWNQHAYSVTNINDDGTIPAKPATNWLTSGLNNFRSNAPGAAPVCKVKGSWTSTGSMGLPRLMHTAALLQDGRVLVAGGFNTTSELYDAATGTWTRTGDTLASHLYHTMTRLLDGRVLITGGGDCPVTFANSELYYPDQGRWLSTGSLVVSRTHHAASLLPDGRVLVMGGEDSNGAVLTSAELYDPATGTWTLTGSLGTARREHTSTLLPNGKVLVAGGNNASSERLTSAELYDPATGTWTPVGSLATGRRYHSATLLTTGKVLVAGGGALDDVSSMSAELYDPATGTWKATGSMNKPRRHHTATLLQNGQVLASAGYHDYTGILTAAELYDPKTGTWCPAGSLNVDRFSHTATLLNDGRVLAVGGASNTDQSSSELFSLGTVAPARSCLELKNRDASLASGVYTLDPCGTGPSSYYCDMTTDGGGWTVAGWQAASAKTSLGVSNWGTPGGEAWSKELACLPYSTIRVFNRTYDEGFSRTYAASTWPATSTNMSIGDVGTAFKQGTYGPSGSLIMMGCIDYSYRGGVYPEYACDSDGERSAKGHLADYAGEYCAGARLDHTWAWSDGTTCRYRGVLYTWGFAIR